MKLSKILSIIIVVFMLVTSISNIIRAVDPIEIKPTEVEGKDDIILLGGKVVYVLQIVGSVASVLVIAILGIKYMMASLEEKAQYKETFGPYIIGAILVFAATTIASVVFKLATGLEQQGGSVSGTPL